MNLPEITSKTFDEIFNKFTNIVLQVIGKHDSVKTFSRKQKNLL